MTPKKKLDQIKTDLLKNTSMIQGIFWRWLVTEEILKAKTFPDLQKRLRKILK